MFGGALHLATDAADVVALRPTSPPCLCHFLDDLFKVHKLKPNVKWRQAFEIYLKTMPPYYLMVNAAVAPASMAAAAVL